MIFSKPPILAVKKLLVNGARLQVIGPKLLVATLFSLFAVISLQAQCVETPTDPCVPVSQSTLDRLAKAVNELTEARKVIAAFQNERRATDAERAAYKNALAITDGALTIFQKGVADRDGLIALQDKVIQTMAQLNDRLLQQLNKKPSMWAKFLSAAKTVLTLAAGITLGRGF